MYRNAFCYNIIIRFLHGGSHDYKIIADMVEGDSILDLACGTCILHKFLPPKIKYEGWELNNKFIRYSNKIGINVKRKNVFVIKNYKGKWDTIIIKDLLHHLCPFEKKLLGSLKGKADYLVVCEPILNKKRLKDRLFEHRLFNFIHYVFGDFDSFNDIYSGRLFQKSYSKSSFIKMLSKFGKITEERYSKEMVIIKIKLKK